MSPSGRISDQDNLTSALTVPGPGPAALIKASCREPAAQREVYSFSQSPPIHRGVYLLAAVMRSIVSIALCLLAIVQSSMQHHSEEIKECADEFHIEKGEFRAFFEEKKQITRDAKCFMKCVLEHINVLKEDGTLDASAMKEHDPELLSYAEECSTIEKNDDLCEFAYQHSLCMGEKVPKDKIEHLVKEHEELLS
ncbi:General odorant-binding protein 57c [Frankliniella fusca]|uniref:General odorant-binding protein 57c n=1 Tax=Frankliniella fusca TaxID=407009 RepID=A0AAE1LTS3_9NEOP|nr:General odorant-binding protein 57c [Frankliniella fusca]